MVGEFCEFEAEISARIVKTFSKAGKTERLARGSAGEQIDFSNVIFSNDFCHIAEVRHFRVMVGEHGRRKRLDFAEKFGFPAERGPCESSGFDAGANAAVSDG